MYKLLSRNFILSIGVLLFASCATPPNKVEPPLPEEQTFSIKVGIDKLADKLLKQLENNGVNNANLVYNTFIDANSGQTLEMSLDIKKLFLEKTEDFKGFKVLSFAPENLNKADYIIDGFIRLEQRNMGKDYRVYAAIINLKDKKSIANDKIWLNKQGLNTKPTQSSKDSPMYSIDLKTLIDAITSSVGQEIADEYFNFLSVDAGISEADKLSSLGKFAEALKICSRIEQSPDGKRGVTYRCLYANYFKSGNFSRSRKTVCYMGTSSH